MWNKKSRRPILTSFVCSFLAIVLAANFVFKKVTVKLPHDPYLVKANELAQQGFNELAQPFFARAMAEQRNEKTPIYCFANSCLKDCEKCHFDPSNPPFYQTINELTVAVDDLRQFGQSANFCQLKSIVRMLEALTYNCSLYESHYYELGCNYNAKNCGGVIKNAVESYQEAYFPILRERFAKLLRTNLKQHYDVELTKLYSKKSLSSLVLIHPDFNNQEKRDRYFQKISIRAQRLRFKSIIFQTQKGIQAEQYTRLLSICEDWQVCMECFDMNAEPGGAIVAFAD